MASFRLILIAIFCNLALMLPSHAANLQPILLADGATHGSGNVPCDGQHHIVASAPINADVVKAYLFVSVGPAVPPNPASNVGGDAIIISPVYGTPIVGPGALADVHQLEIAPSLSYQGHAERTFEPDYVYVSTVEVDLICWGGDTGIVYAEIWTKPVSTTLQVLPWTAVTP